jgi:hypothetical protein
LRDAIRRTTSAPPGQIARRGGTLKRASAAPSHHSNAPFKPESQSILSKIVARSPSKGAFGKAFSASTCAKVCQASLPSASGKF